MDKSIILLTIVVRLSFLGKLWLLLAWPAKHMNETACEIFNVT